MLTSSLSSLLNSLPANPANNEREPSNHGQSALYMERNIHGSGSCFDGSQTSTLLTSNLPGTIPEDTIHPAFRSQLDVRTQQTIPCITPPCTLSILHDSNTLRTNPQDSLLPESKMLLLKQKPLDELRRLQTVKEYVRYQRLDQATKIEAEELYHEYQKKIYLLAFKHRRPAVAICKYLGQGRTRENNAWNNYRALSSEAKNIVKEGDLFHLLFSNSFVFEGVTYFSDYSIKQYQRISESKTKKWQNNGENLHPKHEISSKTKPIWTR